MARNKKIKKLKPEIEKGMSKITKAVKIKPVIKKMAREVHQAPSNLRFAILVTIGVFWADFLKRIVVLWFGFLSVELSTTVSSLIAAIFATIVGIGILESWRRIRTYLK